MEKNKKLKHKNKWLCLSVTYELRNPASVFEVTLKHNGITLQTERPLTRSCDMFITSLWLKSRCNASPRCSYFITPFLVTDYMPHKDCALLWNMLIWLPVPDQNTKSLSVLSFLLHYWFKWTIELPSSEYLAQYNRRVSQGMQYQMETSWHDTKENRTGLTPNWDKAATAKNNEYV